MQAFPVSLPIVFVVDGLIGSGKTTLIRTQLIDVLKELFPARKVVEIPEPVKLWESDGSLARFYADQKRYAYQFQTHVFVSRVSMCRKIVQENPLSTVFVLERSIFTDVLFAQTGVELGTMQSHEYDDYKNLWTMWRELLPFEPNGFIYLNPSLDVCISRIAKRSRNGETVPTEYLKVLEKYYDTYFRSSSQTILRIEIEDHSFEGRNDTLSEDQETVPVLNLRQPNYSNEELREEMKQLIKNM